MGLDAFSLACETVAAQLRLQLDSMDLELLKVLPRYKYVVRDRRGMSDEQGHIPELTVKCLPDTWSLYEHRLFMAASQVDMLIVQSHNAVAPLPVLSLDDGHYYRAGTVPNIARETLTRRNEEEQRLLISMLALGLEAGEQALAAMSLKSRKRYKSRLQACLKPRRGRMRSL
ncbi:MAG TPA: hypothetical protein VFV38_19255 [Ktedonobacteraceae bacterium]|nr:hypothetical protein [Ktedonobacteraceae bacterium]